MVDLPEEEHLADLVFILSLIVDALSTLGLISIKKGFLLTEFSGISRHFFNFLTISNEILWIVVTFWFIL